MRNGQTWISEDMSDDFGRFWASHNMMEQINGGHGTEELQSLLLP
jgi:hypothetical protein